MDATTEPLLLTIEQILPVKGQGVTIVGRIQQGMLDLNSRHALEILSLGQPPIRTSNWRFVGFVEELDYARKDDEIVLLLSDVQAAQVEKETIIGQINAISRDPILWLTTKFDFIIPLSVEQCRANLEIIAEGRNAFKFMTTRRRSPACAIGEISRVNASACRVTGRAGIKQRSILLWLYIVTIVLLVSLLVGRREDHIAISAFILTTFILLPLLVEWVSVRVLVSRLRHLHE